MTKTKRKNGFYWVSTNGKDWHVAEYDDDLWFTCGRNTPVRIDFNFVDPKPLEHGKNSTSTHVGQGVR